MQLIDLHAFVELKTSLTHAAIATNVSDRYFNLLINSNKLESNCFLTLDSVINSLN